MQRAKLTVAREEEARGRKRISLLIAALTVATVTFLPELVDAYDYLMHAF